ncbi:hypothetical protein L0F63_004485 [Massospora cicadina]|nr:hypothetical protein L0F63_004485 [Massospora cicadina]
MAVYLQITSQNILTEKRFDRGLDLLSFKEKLEPITGIPASHQSLTLYRGTTVIQHLVPLPGQGDDSVMLGAFQVEDGSRIHVTDHSGSTQRQAQYQDVSLVEKFEISDHEYNRRSDSVRAFKQRNRLGRFAPEAANEASHPPKGDNAVSPTKINVGERCQVLPPPGQANPDTLYHRGTVRYVGLTGFQPGYWVGVEYDEPYGKNNGRPERVQVGNFAPQSLELDDLDEL